MSIIYRALRTLHAARREQGAGAAAPTARVARRIRLAAAERFLLTPVGLLILAAAAGVTVLGGLLAWEWAAQRLDQPGALVHVSQGPQPVAVEPAAPMSPGQAGESDLAELQVPPAPPASMTAPAPPPMRLDQARLGSGLVRAPAAGAPPGPVTAPGSGGEARLVPGPPGRSLPGGAREAAEPEMSLELPGLPAPPENPPALADSWEMHSQGPPAIGPAPPAAGEAGTPALPSPVYAGNTPARGQPRQDTAGLDPAGVRLPDEPLVSLELPSSPGADSAPAAQLRQRPTHLLPGQRPLAGQASALPTAPGAGQLEGAAHGGETVLARSPQAPTQPEPPEDVVNVERSTMTITRQSRAAQAVAALEAAISAGRGSQVPELLRSVAALKGDDNAYVLKMRGYWALSQGRYDNARGLLARVLEARPTDLDAGLNMAVLELRVGEQASARRRLTRLAEAHPGDERLQELRRRLR